MYCSHRQEKIVLNVPFSALNIYGIPGSEDDIFRTPRLNEKQSRLKCFDIETKMHP